jgi:hypothetical protein
MKTIVKFNRIDHTISGLPVVLTYYEGDVAFYTAAIKRIKYGYGLEIVEAVDVDGTIYRKASGKRRGRPKKEQPAT